MRRTSATLGALAIALPMACASLPAQASYPTPPLVYPTTTMQVVDEQGNPVPGITFAVTTTDQSRLLMAATTGTDSEEVLGAITQCEVTEEVHHISNDIPMDLMAFVDRGAVSTPLSDADVQKYLASAARWHDTAEGYLALAEESKANLPANDLADLKFLIEWTGTTLPPALSAATTDVTELNRAIESAPSMLNWDRIGDKIHRALQKHLANIPETQLAKILGQDRPTTTVTVTTDANGTARVSALCGWGRYEHSPNRLPMPRLQDTDADFVWNLNTASLPRGKQAKPTRTKPLSRQPIQDRGFTELRQPMTMVIAAAPAPAPAPSAPAPSASTTPRAVPSSPAPASPSAPASTSARPTPTPRPRPGRPLAATGSGDLWTWVGLGSVLVASSGIVGATSRKKRR